MLEILCLLCLTLEHLMSSLQTVKEINKESQEPVYFHVVISSDWNLWGICIQTND